MTKTRRIISQVPYILAFATKRDSDWCETNRAIGLLHSAQHMRQQYDDTLQAAITTYGDVQNGRYIAGVYAEHFPDSVKDRLRVLARNIGEAVNSSLECWQKAGRRRETWLVFKDEFKKLKDNRVSYY